MKHLVILLFLSSLLRAYVPASDQVIIENKVLRTYSCPMTTFPWRGTKPKLSEHPDPGTSESRSLEAIWEIRDGNLYLIAISAFCFDEFASRNSIGLKEIMSDRIRNGRVFADWYTGDFEVIEVIRGGPKFSPDQSGTNAMTVILKKYKIDKGRVTDMTK